MIIQQYGKRNFADVIRVPNQLTIIQREIILVGSNLPNQPSLLKAKVLFSRIDHMLSHKTSHSKLKIKIVC